MPAVAVIRGELVLLGIIGRKGYVGCIDLHIFKDNRCNLLKIYLIIILEFKEDGRIFSGKVKFNTD